MRFSEFFGCEWTDLGGGRFRGTVFDRGDLKFMIVRVIARRPMHGYEVMRALEEESRGCYRASPGSVYPTLQMLEDEGYLASDRVEGKRVYSVTPAGEAEAQDGRGAHRLHRRDDLGARAAPQDVDEAGLDSDTRNAFPREMVDDDRRGIVGEAGEGREAGDENRPHAAPASSARCTKLWITLFSPALSNRIDSLSPSTAVTSP